MPTQKQYSDHTWMLEALTKAQDDDHDNREIARAAHAFVNEPDGQWEDNWREICRDRPRYTFDLTNPMIEQITGSIAKSDYDIKVLPAGGKATKKKAQKYEGIVRHIEAISNASEIYSKSGRSMAVKGLDGWEIVQKYQDGDSFDQDLMIAAVPNWLDRVWFGPHTEQDGSDAPYAWKLIGLTEDEFKAKYPKEDVPTSVSTDQSHRIRYNNRNDLILVGTFYYKKAESRELVAMSNGKTHVVDDDFEMLADEYTAMGVTELRRRTRTINKIYTRMFTNDDWLGEAKETVFENWIPLVPLYANFDYMDDCLIYFGAVLKMMDWQRVFNYSKSREIEDGAFAPRAKYWLSTKMVAGPHAETLSTLNTNNDPVQIFNPDPEMPNGPLYMGGAKINEGLHIISEDMRTGLTMSAGMYAAGLGDNPGLQSGVAIERLQDRSDIGSNKYIEARTIAQRQTGRILVNAIPRVYDIGREMRILADDGSFDMEVIGEAIQDQQTGEVITLHDLAEGQYDVTCSTGPSFTSRQAQTVDAITKYGTADPSLVQLGGDVLASNINGPGMDVIGKRKRRQLFTSGALVPEELTDEERAEVEQMQQQPPQPDAMMVAAQAEQAKAQADLISAQTKQQEAQMNYDLAVKDRQIRSFEAATKRYEADIDRANAIASIGERDAKTAKLLEEIKAQKIENMGAVVSLLPAPQQFMQ